MSLASKRQMKVAPTNDEELWQAVLARNSQLDGEFVFAVSSTGVYCRPSCPARRAHRSRVSFFRFPAAAEQAGFRACLRCRPREATLVDPQLAVVQQACELIARADETITLASLSESLGISAFHLQRTFRKIVGITPRQFAEAQRTKKFKAGVREGQAITSALYDAGYGSSSRLYERANVELGMTPATYSRNGRGAMITYAIAGCHLGRLLVAATAQGICAVSLGRSDCELESTLHNEFSAGFLERNDAQMSDWVSQILQHLEGKRPNLNLPLDIQATAFQRLVWNALRAIPYGSHNSYSEVANAVGRPTAVRAVARACATNPVALIIPCHRVIKEDESLGGYRWGLERKQQLLAREQSIAKQLATDANSDSPDLTAASREV